jgi:hypothetical protein
MGQLNVRVARVLIGGDTCPTGANEGLFESGSASDILGDVATVVEQSDRKSTRLNSSHSLTNI